MKKIFVLIISVIIALSLVTVAQAEETAIEETTTIEEVTTAEDTTAEETTAEDETRYDAAEVAGLVSMSATRFEALLRLTEYFGDDDIAEEYLDMLPEDYWSQILPEIETAEEVITAGETQTEAEVTALTEDETATDETEEKRLAAIEAIAGLVGDESKAEELLDKMIAAGDSAFEDSSKWLAIKENLSENRDTYIAIVAAVLAVIGLLTAGLILLVKIIPTCNKTQYGVKKYNEAITNANGIMENLSVKIEKILDNIGEQYAEMIKYTEDKAQKVVTLETALANSEAGAVNAQEASYAAVLAQLEMFYLVLRRMGLPVNDMSSVDMWYAKAKESLESVFTDGQKERTEDLTEAIRKVSEGNEEGTDDEEE